MLDVSMVIESTVSVAVASGRLAPFVMVDLALQHVNDPYQSLPLLVDRHYDGNGAHGSSWMTCSCDHGVHSWRGVGAARNEGANLATSEYLWFIDPDDTFSADILEALVLAARLNDADIAVCPYTHSDRPVPHAPTGVFNRREAALLLLQERLTGHLWNKLIRRSLVLARPFPEDMACYSDLAGFIGFLGDAERIAMTAEGLYVYANRPGSLTKSVPVEMRVRMAGICSEQALSLARSVGLDESPIWGGVR